MAPRGLPPSLALGHRLPASPEAPRGQPPSMSLLGQQPASQSWTKDHAASCLGQWSGDMFPLLVSRSGDVAKVFVL